MILTIKVSPKAKETRYMGQMSDGTLKFRVNAIPEDGKANTELINQLAKMLHLAKQEIVLESGASSRMKQIRIPDHTPLPW